jgi:hypothetical protein
MGESSETEEESLLKIQRCYINRDCTRTFRRRGRGKEAESGQRKMVYRKQGGKQGGKVKRKQYGPFYGEVILGCGACW